MPKSPDQKKNIDRLADRPAGVESGEVQSPGRFPIDAIQRLVYVVDDDASIQQSLTFLLSTRNIVIRAFSSGAEFLEQFDGLLRAPVILDLWMPLGGGIQVLRDLAERAINWPVIVLSAHGAVDSAVEAMQLGAIDFLEKPVKPSELEKCLERAFHKLDDERDSGEFKAAARQALALLTPRESQVLAELSKGRGNKQVAFILSISPRTVEMHRANALRRLGVKTIAEVVTIYNRAKP